MSHVASIAVEIDNLEALAAAAARLGGELVLGQRTYKWFGQFVGDTPLPPGVSVADLGKCDHAIRFPNDRKVHYEVGVVAQPTGRFRLQYDYWDGYLKTKLGGQAAPALVQAYATEKTLAALRRRGMVAQESKMADGTIRLVVRGQ